jgi:protein-L-isoaspartate(D-aspartate) O-methyltransferase
VTSADTLRSVMVAGLVERGELSAPWREVFDTVPRHWFIPDRVWRQDECHDGPSDLVPVDRASDPGCWAAMAYANDSVITQVDDGHPSVDGRGREVSSSASMPAVVATMLTALEVEPGMRVLEIGTGTGWNTALLAQRLGPDAVTSIEVDPAVASHARARLAEHGFGAVRVVTGDGAQGWPQGAPYDRVLATVAAPLVPHPWVAQTRPGGLVLAPWGTAYYPGGLLRIEVGDGGVGRGRIVGDESFMALRAQRQPRESIAAYRDAHPEPVTGSTDLHPWYLRGDQAAATAIGIRLPGVRCFYSGHALYLTDRASLSWATVDVGDDPPYRVAQAGPRALFDEAVAAYEWWTGAGKPGVDAWLVTVDLDGRQTIELGGE